MSEPTLVVPTAFTDISQLAEGLVGRVEPERLMLYGPEAYEPGTTVHFVVTLLDGNVALEGRARAVQAVDGGEEREEQARYDVIFDSLDFAGSSTVVYERILLIQQDPAADTGQVYVEDAGEGVEETVELGAFEEAEPAPVEEVVQVEAAQVELEQVEAEPEYELLSDAPMEEVSFDEPAPVEPAVTSAVTPTGGPLLRPSLPSSWEPMVEPAEGGQPPSGYFQFSGLPTPAQAPRPDLDPGYHVQAAPSPSTAVAVDPAVAVDRAPAAVAASPPPILEEEPTEAYSMENLPAEVSAAAVGLVSEVEVELEDVDDASFEDVARELDDGP